MIKKYLLGFSFQCLRNTQYVINLVLLNVFLENINRSIDRVDINMR